MPEKPLDGLGWAWSVIGMGRLVQRVKIQSLLNKEERVEVDALVDIGASIMALPAKYKSIFPSTELYDAESVIAAGLMPVKIGAGFLVQVADFRPTSADIAFIEGLDGPLIGYTCSRLFLSPLTCSAIAWCQ